MRNKILADILVYVLSPIIVLNLINEFETMYFITALSFLISIYTVIIRTKYSRINLTGIAFSFLYIMFFYYKQKIEPGYDTYVYNTYFLIICSILILFISLINKNIVKQVYIDILKSNGTSYLNIWNLVKKPENIYYFNKMTYTIIIHLLVMILIRVYSMNTYGVQDYTYTKELEILISVLFIMGELYILSKLSNKTIKEDNILTSKNIKVKNSSKRVINFNKYKNMNK